MTADDLTTSVSSLCSQMPPNMAPGEVGGKPHKAGISAHYCPPHHPPSWHLEGVICTWVAEPQGGGGATLLAALGATHRLLTTKGPAGVFPYTTPAPRWHLQPCRAGFCLGPVAAAVLWGHCGPEG